MSLPVFNQESELERDKFREAIRKRIKGGALLPKLSFQDKIKLEKKIFGPKGIETISLEDYRKALEKIDKLKLKTTTETERRSIESRVRYLKKVGGIKSLKKPLLIKQEKKNSSTLEEKPKDTSAFQGRPYLKREDVRRWLKRDEVWKITKIPAKSRPALEKKLFDPKRFGSFVDRREADIVYKDFKDYPMTRARMKYGMKSRRETARTFKLLKKFLGK